MKRILILLMIIIPVLLLNAITLEESITLAKEHNKELLAEKSGFEAAEWARKNAFTNFLPKASFNSMMIRIDDETYDMANAPIQIPEIGMEFPAMFPIYKTSYTNDITIQQPIFNGGKVILGYQLAGLAKQQAELVFSNKTKDVSYAVATTYLGILKMQDLKILSTKSLNSTLSHLETALKKYDVGTAKKSDILQWQLKMKNDETAILELENGIDEMFGFWQVLIGKHDDLEPEAIDVKQYDSEIILYANIDKIEMEIAADEFLDEVNSSSPALQSLDLMNKMMKKNLMMAKGEFLPSLNLQFSYQIEKDDTFDFDGDDNWNLAAVFSWPFFSSGANYTNLIKTKHDLKKAEYETANLQENYLAAARNVFNRLITKARVVEDNKTALEFAGENHMIINDLFKQGLVTNTELLDAEAMLYGSEMQLIASYYDFILLKYEMKKFIR